jgi:hypothetical protein
MLGKHLCYFPARVEQSDSFFQCLYSSSYYGARVQSSRTVTIRESMCPAGYPEKHTPCLYPRHKQDQPVPLLSRGPGPRPNWDSKPQHCRPGLSVVLRLQTHNPSITVGPERAGTHDKRVTSLPTLISKYMLGIISL